MDKNMITLAAFIAALTLTACGNSGGAGETNADTSAGDMSQNVTSEQEQTSASGSFTGASGTVTVLKTAVLCLAPESGAGYAGFIAQGTEARLKGTDEAGEWSLIEYEGEKYYVLSAYLDSGDNGTETDETMSQNVTSSVESSTEGKETSTSDSGGITVKETTASSGNGASGNGTFGSTSAGSPAVPAGGSTSGSTTGSASGTASVGSTSGSASNSGSQTTTPATRAPVWHEPVYTTTQVWVVDKAAWTEEVKTEKQVPVYENVEYIVCTCGYETTDVNESVNHTYMHMINDEPSAYKVETRKEITGYETQYDISYVNHPEEGHYETQTILVSEGYWE